MKRCPNGHVTYNDSLTFCTECGKVLGPAEPGVNKPGEPGENHVIPAKKKGAWYVIKRVLIVLAVLLVLGIIWISHLINSTTYITLSENSLSFSKGGGMAEVGIDHDGLIWEVTYAPSWVECTETENTLYVSAEGNRTGAVRDDHITVKSGRLNVQLPVFQQGFASTLRVNPTRITVDRDGATKFIDVECDGVEQTVGYSPDICDIETNVGTGFNIIFPRNDGASKNGVVTVSEDYCSATVSFHQIGDCTYCNGRGKRDCIYCFGQGTIGFGYFSTICTACGGEGKVKCSYCNGTGEY